MHRRLSTAAAHGLRPRHICRGPWLPCFIGGIRGLAPPPASPSYARDIEPSLAGLQGRHTPQQAYYQAPVPPKSQRQSHPRNSDTAGWDADHTTTYAQAVSSPIPTDAEDPLMRSSLQPQLPIRNGARGPQPQPPAQAQTETFLHYQQPPHAYQYVPHQMVPDPHNQPPPCWQAYFQAIPTKEDFKQSKMLNLPAELKFRYFKLTLSTCLTQWR